ncbi:hypothetical protein QQ045_006287 [Rhodiola kirilowii]
MGFVVTTLIFAMIGVILALSVRIFCNKGSSANLVVGFCEKVGFLYGWELDGVLSRLLIYTVLLDGMFIDQTIEMAEYFNEMWEISGCIPLGSFNANFNFSGLGKLQLPTFVSSSKVQVEYAPSQQMPKPLKKDGREGTIVKDPECIEFLEKKIMRRWKI